MKIVRKHENKTLFINLCHKTFWAYGVRLTCIVGNTILLDFYLSHLHGLIHTWVMVTVLLEIFNIFRVHSRRNYKQGT